MNPKRQNHEERRFARLFDGAMNNVPPADETAYAEVPPDQDFLDRLRETSTEVFVQHASPSINRSKRRNKMLVIALRALTTSAAVVAVAFGLIWSSKPSLTDDGRIGKVADLQGIVSVKPLNQDRWSPVAARLVLQPGDRLRTDTRGANAVKMRLMPQTDVTLGPGSIIELIEPGRARLLSGEVKIVADAKSPLELRGPDDQKLSVEGTQILRIDGKKIVPVKKPPQWLQGFEGASNNESIGSLIAKVDGRNVPLTVGYHKVAVDIRDQIARTVIEESFVNHTDARLEGVFYFPLPQDASISGFAMWIGDELVEADVVEKQRAREIYETILRERRDPGLLEWSGGNIFKARVFPIFAHSEKRIKITYTQVLPRRGNRYRYSYSLQSELLKQHPLRELAVDVKINSAVSLSKVTSPTHPARINRTDHSARVQFDAQEYTPTSDFEVVVETDGRQNDVVVIPHRRGDDGYFMMQLAPPSDSGQWQRDVLPDGDPVNLLILADTSASMDDGARRRQAELLASLLGSLTAKDAFNLATCDVETTWTFDKLVKPDEKTIATARDFLDRRVSLGWTNLDAAFKAALEKTAANTHIVYIGDGMVTAKDADPVRFADRLRRLYEGKTATCHAVAASSSFEPLVLKTIASLGGGSVRFISGQSGPQAAALELLGEITQPGVRDLKVEFIGLRTARVYPRRLPNLPAGSQQILLGRYLPEGKDQKGRVVVSGRRGNETIRMKTEVSLADAEKGNSFIPRLWARMHLDELLDQGATPSIKDEIIALSEEYHIMTPYTSLLVLESDEDRERFKVKRRFQMRDGQKFFAQGRDNADYELVQQQMRRAGGWRLGLRAAALRDLAGLGRVDNVHTQSQLSQQTDGMPVSKGLELGGMSSPMGGPMSALQPMSGGKAGQWEGLGFGGDTDYAFGVRNGQIRSTSGISDRKGGHDLYDYNGDTDLFKKQVDSGEKLSEAMDWEEPEEAAVSFDMPARSLRLEAEPYFLFDGDMLDSRDSRDRSSMARQVIAHARKPASKTRRFDVGLALHGERSNRAYIANSPRPIQWLGTLFPWLPPVEKQEREEPKCDWPQEARQLAGSLLRTKQMAGIDGGVRVELKNEYYDTLRDELNSRSETLALVSPGLWLVSSGGNVNWCDKSERGVLSKAFRLGRLRKSTAKELAGPPLGLSGYTLGSLERTYYNYKATVQPHGDNHKLLILKHRDNPESEVRVTIDIKRHVITKMETMQHGKKTHTTTFGDFGRWADAWWAGSIEQTDAEGRRNSLITQTFKTLNKGRFDLRIKAELAARSTAQFIHEPLVSVKDAKQHIADGKAAFDDQLAMLLYFSQTQQWERALKHLAAAEELAKDKPGMRHVRTSVLNMARRREEAKKRYFKDARALAKDAAKQDESLFLANYIREQASRILQQNEMLELLDVLRPVYKRQPPLLLAMKNWGAWRADCLQNTNRAEDEIKLRKQLATEYPGYAHLQQRYTQRLFDKGEQKAARAWLKAALGKDRKWREHEKESLRNVQAQFIRNQGRYAELADYLAAWIEDYPETNSAYAQYLTALIRADSEKEALRQMGKWFDDARKPQAQEHGRLKPAALARLNAAISQALGQGYNLYTNRLDERWYKPLEQTAQFFAAHKQHGDIANRIMCHHHFLNTDACRRVRKQAADMLLNRFEELGDAQVRLMADWIKPNDPAVEADNWKIIADHGLKRWNSISDIDAKHRFGAILMGFMHKASDDEGLTFLRRQYQQGPEKYRAGYAKYLLNALLTQPWSEKIEDEAFGLLDKQTDSKDPAIQLSSQIGGLQRLTDRMVKARYEARMKTVEHQEKLTRTELRDKKTEALRLARQSYADRLKKRTQKVSKPLSDWFTIERLYVEMQIKRDPQRIAEECWELLAAKPKKWPDEPESMQLLDEMLQNRAIATLSNLAARKAAKPEPVKRLLDYFDAGIAVDAGNPYWKQVKYRLLIALDLPEQLEAALRSWIEPDSTDNHWRRSLAFLLAEQGILDEAIAMLEAVEKADELLPDDYRALAGWYMAVGRRDRYRRATIDAYKTTDEWRLNNWLQQRLNNWQNGDGNIPTEMHKDVPLVFAAIFEKSGNPAGYLWILQQFYKSTHEFRLLSGLADAVVGHTAGKVYPFIQEMGRVFAEIRDEATADSIIEHLEESVRPRAKTDVDRRALDLMQLQIERRAAELINQPGPHAKKALEAMRRAFKRKWSEGEPRLMADFLAGLGNISQPDLAAEQLSELEVLYARADKGSAERLHIAHKLAETLWSYGRQDRAMDLLANALAERQNANDGVLPAEAQQAIGCYVGFLKSKGHFVRGESFLKEQLAHAVNQQHKKWLTLQLYVLYEAALQNGGQVSMGNGATLYEAVQKAILDELKTDDQNQRWQFVERLLSIYRTVDRKKVSDVDEDLRAFAFKRVPEILKRQADNQDSIIRNTAETLKDLIGHLEGLAFLIERLENEPVWWRYQHQDGWSRYGAMMAHWREIVKPSGELEERLLAIVTAELRRDLETRQPRNRQIYWQHHGHFWKEKTDAFAQTAEEVLDTRKDSSAAVSYIAEYLFRGLDRHDRAIDILFDADRRKVLDENAQYQLVEFLHERNRHGESIAILLPWIERRPDNLKYRTRLMHAYFRTNQREALLSLLQETDAHFHKENRWDENAMNELAKSCLENELFERSVEYHKELIASHQRSQPRRGVGNDELSYFYMRLARAFSGLKNTADAVDAAGAAIVAWGPRHDRRAEAINTLVEVLRGSPDLDAYVAELDKSVAETGMENPIVRKYLGQVYIEQEKYAKAAAQLKTAVQSQPNDAESHKKLIECYDRQNDKAGAVAQLLDSLQLSRRDIGLWADLGKRYIDMKKPKQAERAYTSMVEMLPHESESHSRLAVIRQEQGRWADASGHWRQVAQIRELEPTGLMKLAEAQVHLKQWDQASETLKMLRARTWPDRFGNVPHVVSELEQRIRNARNEK